MNKLQSGQALVLVLLTLAVVLTIVLYILGRSVTDIAVSTSESQSVNAFSAAEAGVEQALVIGTGSGGNVTLGDAIYNSTVSDVGRGATSFIYPIELNSGDNMILWLRSQDTSTNFTGGIIKICWGRTGTASNNAQTPAIEVSLFYETSANNPATGRIYRASIDPYVSRSPGNDFAVSAGSCTVAGQVFPFSVTLNSLPSNKVFASVRMFYNTGISHPIAFDSTNASTFPTQGKLINSSGTSGQSSRRVEVFQGWPEIPSVFLYGVYSPVGLTK